MIKRYLNLFIKLFLIIIFVLLCFIILGCEEAAADIYIGNTKSPIAILVQPEPYQYITEQEEDYSAKIKQWEEEHYYATKAWEYLREEGFSQEITCAIIGNMMIETSGGALDLEPTIYSLDGDYYGLCQWSKEYYPEAHGLTFEEQLDYLIESMPQEFNTFGWLYEDNFDYSTFLVITDVEEAAFAFAVAYERCGPASYEMRQEAAVRAYKYFDLED